MLLVRAADQQIGRAVRSAQLHVAAERHGIVRLRHRIEKLVQ